MRFEAALSMNLIKHLLACEKGKKGFLTPPQARELYITLKDYLAHNRGFSRTTIEFAKVRFGGIKMPYRVKDDYDLVDQCAVAYNGRLYLFFVHHTSLYIVYPERMINSLAGLHLQRMNIAPYYFFAYTCDLCFENIAYLRIKGWQVDTNKEKFSELIDIDRSRIHPKTFPYQVEGIRMLCSGYRLLADEQGLGKTLQVLQFIKYEGFCKILICCPATLKLNWRREIMLWTDTPADKITLVEGTNPYKVNNKYTIINYDLLPYWEEELKKEHYDILVADECHYVQSPTAKRTQAFSSIVENTDDAVFISGTPFTSQPAQMFTALHNIAPRVFRSLDDFGERFCFVSKYMGNVQYKGARNTKLLHDILSDGICIRRLKKDVLEELPDKMRVTVPIGLSADEVKKSSVYKPIYALEQKIKSSKDALGTLEYQRQIAYLRKRDAVNDWIRDFLESGKKLVVFGVHTATLDAVEAAFPDISVRIDGSTPNKLRDKNVQKFQNDPDCRLFIGNVQAAGTGITLTAASDAVFIECGWVASQLLQAEDRIHRIGAKNACIIYYMAVPDTIDEKIIDIVNYKAKMHTMIFDESGDNMLEDLKKKNLEYKRLFNN